MEKKSPVRVRFAPSPTGWLHIGGARTALFNWLFARHHNGQFLLRIEDTDRARSNAEMTQGILDSLAWLGLDWDEEIVYQAQGIDRHKAVAAALLDGGRAYRCFCTPESLQAKREAAEKAGGGYVYDGSCRALSDEAVAAKLDEGTPFTVRFKAPEGETVFNDAVRGTVTVQNNEIDDFIILRSDGTPVYQVAVVVDDHDMGITHVIRGDDHLSNTPKQILIYRAMDWAEPRFGHVPMILGPDKKRLSKRHGATAVGEYKDAGFLPEAVTNYLALLSWSPGDDREILSQADLVEAFSIDKVSKNASVFDEAKLEWMNGQYIYALSDKDLLERVLPGMEAAGLLSLPLKSEKEALMRQIVPLLKERMKRVTDFPELSAYFFNDPKEYEEKAAKKHWLKEGVTERMEAIVSLYEGLDAWTEEALESSLRQLAESLEVGAGKLIHPIRLAVTGRGSSPGLFELLTVLGQETVLRRLRAGMEWIALQQ